MYGANRGEQSVLPPSMRQSPENVDISTHNALKISLHNSANMRYKVDGGFVGPLREIYAYKEEKPRDSEEQRRANRRAVVKMNQQRPQGVNSQQSVTDEDDNDDDDDFSM